MSCWVSLVIGLVSCCVWMTNLLKREDKRFGVAGTNRRLAACMELRGKEEGILTLPS